MEVGSSWLDQHGPKNALQVKKKRTHVALDFYPSGSALWSTDFPPSGYAIDLLDPAARAEGDVWVKGMAEPAPIQGSVAVTHSWTNAAESDLVLRRLEFFSLPQCGQYDTGDVVLSGRPDNTPGDAEPLAGC